MFADTVEGNLNEQREESIGNGPKETKGQPIASDSNNVESSSLTESVNRKDSSLQDDSLQINEMAGILEKQESEWKKMVSETQQECAQIERQLSALQEEYNKTVSDIAKCHSENYGIIAERESLESEVIELKREQVADYSKTLLASEKEISDVNELSSSLQGVLGDLENLLKKVASFAENAQTAAQQNDAIASELAFVREQLKTAEENNVELASVREQLRLTEDTNVELAQHTSVLERDLQSASSLQQQLSSELSGKVEFMSRLEGDLGTMRAYAEKAEAAKFHLFEEREKHEQEILALTKQVKELDLTVQEGKEVMNSLKAANADLDSLKKELERVLMEKGSAGQGPANM